jgi:hypothetical protein
LVERDAYAGTFDVSTALLNSDLAEDVYLRLPKELGDGALQLWKALYVLRQVVHARHLVLCKVMEELKYRVSSCAVTVQS